MSEELQNYLNNIRNENEYYQGYDNYSLYEELYGDKNMPSWDFMDSKIKNKGNLQSKIDKETSPKFIDSLLEMSDYGLINEDSWEFMKKAYNDSATGLAYQLATGKAKFSIDPEWEANIGEDVLSAVASFLMPLDFASMFVGGWIGKAGLSATMASKGVQRQAIKNMVAASGGKISKRQATKQVAKIVSNESKGVGFLFPKTAEKFQTTMAAMPRGAAAGLSASTLATFEGTKGGLMAAINGEDVWKGIRDGVMHGGAMGGVIGYIGGSLNVINAALVKKSKKVITGGEKTAESLKKYLGQEGAEFATGKVGQVATEGLAFTAPDVYKVINDDTFTMKDLTRNALVNVGMMSVLKAKQSLLGDVKKESLEYLYGITKNVTIDTNTMLDNISKNIKRGEGDSDSNTGSKVYDRITGVAEKYISNVADKLNNLDLIEGGTGKLTLKEIQKLEKDVDKLEKDIKSGKSPEKIHKDDYNDHMKTIYSLYEILNQRLSLQKNDVNVKKGVVERLESLINKWETDILAPLQNKNKYGKQKIKSSEEKRNLEDSLTEAIDNAIKNKKEAAIKNLIKDNSDFITVKRGKKGELLEVNIKDKDGMRWDILEQRINNYKPTIKKTITVGKKIFKTKDVQDINEKVTGKDETSFKVTDKQKKDKSDTRKTIDEQIDSLNDKLREKTTDGKSPYTQAELENFKTEKAALEAGKDAQDLTLPGIDSSNAYNNSKPILARIVDQILKRTDLIGTGKTLKEGLGAEKMVSRIRFYNKFVKWLATEHGKSIHELTQTELQNWFDSGNGKISHNWDLSKLLKFLKYDNVLLDSRAIKTYEGGSIKNLLSKVGPTKDKEGLRGARTFFSQAKPGSVKEYWNFGKNFVEFIQPKKLGERIKKFITEDVGKKLQKLYKTETGGEGNRQFMFKETNFSPIVDTTLRYIVSGIFGKKNIPAKAAKEHRAFRYSFVQWAVEKYKGDTKAAKVLKLILGDKPPTETDLIAIYGKKDYSKGKYQKDAKKWVKEYLADIEQGGYFLENNPKNKFIEFKSSDKKAKSGKDKGGYLTWEIKKGLENLKTEGYKVQGEDIKGKVITILEVRKKDIKVYNPKTNKFHYINKDMAETMIQYMIQTAPRINEVVPTQKVLNKVKADETAFMQSFVNQKTKKSTSEYKLSSQEVADKIVTALELKDLVKWAKKAYKDKLFFPKKWEKDLGKFNGQYILGRLTGHFIEIASGRAGRDVLPHEVVEFALPALKSMGDKASKEMIKKATRMFRKDGDTVEQAEHRFIDALGDYVAKRVLEKSTLGRIKSWVIAFNDYLRQKLNITNPNDVDRIKDELVSVIGEKVYKGRIPKDYIPEGNALKIKYKKGNTELLYKDLLKVHNATRVIMRKAYKSGVSKKNILKIIQDELGIEVDLSKGFKQTLWNIKKSDKNSVNAGQLWNLQSRINSLREGRGQNKKKLSINEEKVIDIENLKNILPETRNKIFKDVFGVDFKKASDAQINAYRTYLLVEKDYNSMNTSILSFYDNYDKKTKQSLQLNQKKTMFMTVGDVLRNYGGKWGEQLSLRLDQHDYVRTKYYAEAKVFIDMITDIINTKSTKFGEARNVKNNYMHLMDKDLAEGAIKQLRELSQKHKWAEKELAKAEEIAAKFGYRYVIDKNNKMKFIDTKNGDFYEARRIWKNLSDGLFDALGVEISKNTNASQFKSIMESLNSSYIKDYFTRRVRNEVLLNWDSNASHIRQLASGIKSKLTKKDLKKISEKLIRDKIINKGSVEHKKLLEKESRFLDDFISNEIFNMYSFGPAKVSPYFLKSRGAQLPEYINIKVNGKKKLVKTYESSIDATMNHYGLGMAKLLATVRLFPEWTDFGGKFNLNAGTRANIVKQMESDTGIGQYSLLAIKRQLGLDMDSSSRLNESAHQWIGTSVNLMAVSGLSSPTSGIKNLIIQIPRTAYIFGARNTLTAIGRGLKIMNDPVLFQQAVREGLTGYGQKTTLLETPGAATRTIKWWFENINQMERSENFNRIVLAEAGKMYFNEIVGQIRGEQTLFLSHRRMNESQLQAEYNRYLKQNWRLSDKQIDLIVNGKDIYGTQEFNKMLEWVGHQSHKRGAGATGVADLPLWMSRREVKPFTLFQRIAASVTIDTYHNVVKPIVKSGNIAPLIKASIGHAVSGAALYHMYKWAFNQQIPSEESEFLDRMVSYIWRSEALGVFGELLQPLLPGGRDEFTILMEPVIWRNSTNAWDNFRQWTKGTKSWKNAIADWTTDTVVLMGQFEKAYNNTFHPYVTKSKNIKTLENVFRDEANHPKQSGIIEGTTRTPFYWNLKKAIMTSSSDEKIAEEYWAAYNYIADELEKKKGWTNINARDKEVKRLLKLTVSSMNPLKLTKDERGRQISLKEEFLAWLSPKNRKIAEDLEKTYYVKKRRYESIISSPVYKKKYSIYYNN